MRLTPLLIGSVILVMTSCGKSSRKPEYAQNEVAWPDNLPEHQAMVKYLADLQQQYFLQPGNRYASTMRAKKMLAQEPPKDEKKRMQFIYETAFECLSAGMTDQAIQLLEENLEQAAKMPPAERSRMRNLLGICYLRYGEQQNCISNHVAESCILPIDSKAMYTVREATEKGYALYQEILKDEPDNLNAIFLLNVAAMNLGYYPDKVPSQWLIPVDRFGSEFSMEKFPNIAIPLDVDVITLSGGVCTEDFNNDGYIDIFTSSWFLGDNVHYFQNNGDGTFTDRTKEANLEGITGGLNLIHADYNNDGFRDVFIPRGGWWNDYGKVPNSLLKNNGDGTFTDVTKSSGLFSLYPTQTAVWSDFNNDGWLDLFVGNESRKNSEEYRCELFMSNGDGTFTNKAKEAGADLLAFSKGVAACDYDHDGLSDIAISSQGQPNILLHNESDGDQLRFRDVSGQAGISGPVKSFPLTFLDYDNDGWEDLFIFTYDASNCDYDNAAEYLGKPVKGEYSVLYHNNGDGTFSDISAGSGIQHAMTAMGFNYGDIDNDGFIDLYVGTGTPEYTSLVPNRMLRNNGGKGFQDVTHMGGFGHLQKGHGIGFADFDQDGDSDIYEDMGGGYEGDPFQSAFFENPGNGNNWTCLQLEGVQCNRDAIGARVHVAVTMADGSKQIFHHLVGTGGSFGSNSLQLECGLGNAAKIDSVTVDWPGGSSETFADIPLKSCVQLKQGTGMIGTKELHPFRFTHAPDQMDHSMHMEM